MRNPTYIKEMEGKKYIDRTREYLDYLEDHLTKVAIAFDDLSNACEGMWWVGDDYAWHTLRRDVELHDISKFSEEEFVQYRKTFYPIDKDEKENVDFKSALEHHKEQNHHHFESCQTYLDMVHMIIDWTAMSYTFGGTAQEYYEKNKEKIIVPTHLIPDMYEIFIRLSNYERSLS